jgi:hypothetical protein
MSHARTCEACWAAALREDPLLFFARLPPVHVEPAEVTALQEQLRHNRRLPRRRAAWRRYLPSSLAAWSRAAAGILLVLVLAAVEPGANRQQLPGGGSRQEPVVSVVDEAQLSPLIEDLSSRDAQIYQLAAGDVAVVMVVDSTLDL